MHRVKVAERRSFATHARIVITWSALSHHCRELLEEDGLVRNVKIRKGMGQKVTKKNNRTNVTYRVFNINT